MDENELLMAYVISIRLRTTILQELYNEGILQQSYFIKKFNFPQQNVSNVMKDLKERDLVECLSLNKRGWKPYRLTLKGVNAIEGIAQMKANKVKKLDIV